MFGRALNESDISRLYADSALERQELAPHQLNSFILAVVFVILVAVVFIVIRSRRKRRTDSPAFR